MKLTLKRFTTSDQGTFGKLYLNDAFVCYTGELPEKAGNPSVPNERRTDCIPRGTYDCAMRPSAKFGRAYEVKNVPNRTAILIHAGNMCGDISKGFKSDVEGCIILGTNIGKLYGQDAVLNSRQALDRLKLLTSGKPFELTIE